MPSNIRCLVLACGNTLRSDDGVGPQLAHWAADRFAHDPRVRAIARQQWTPDLAEDIASSEAIIFVDCSLESYAGQITLRDVVASLPQPGFASHHTGAPELLALAQDLYSKSPARAILLTIGAGSIELGESLSPPVHAALPDARDLLELTIRQLLG